MTGRERDARFAAIVAANYNPAELRALEEWARYCEQLQAEQYAKTGKRYLF